MPCDAYWADLIAVAAKGGAPFQGPATIYLALVSDTPTNLVNGAVVVTFPTPTGGDDWAWSLEAWTAASAGQRLWFEPLSVPIHLTADLPAVEFPLGTLHFGVV